MHATLKRNGNGNGHATNGKANGNGHRLKTIFREIRKPLIEQTDEEISASVAAAHVRLAKARGPGALFSEVEYLTPAAAAALKVHQFATRNKRYSPEDRASFVRRLRRTGRINVAVILYKGQVLDGVNRRDGAVEVGLSLPVVHFLGNDEQAGDVVQDSENRRHQTPSENAASFVLVERDKARLAGRDPSKVAELRPGEKSREVQAARAGCSARLIQDAHSLPDEDLELCAAGEDTVPARVRFRRDAAKATTLAVAAAKLPKGFDPATLFKVHCGDVRKVLPTFPRARAGRPFDLVATDPPYNIGVDYGDGVEADDLPDEEYLKFCRGWLTECRELLAPRGVMVVINNHEYAAELRMILRHELKLKPVAWITWYEKFGVVNSGRTNFSRNGRHIHVFANGDGHVFNWRACAQRSMRETPKSEGGYADKRKKSPGKVADDVWDDIPRLTNHSPERIPSCPNQLPLALMRRIVQTFCDPGMSVLDPFVGSGTTLEAAIEHGCYCEGVDVNAGRVERARQRVMAAIAASPRAVAEANVRAAVAAAGPRR